MSCSGRITETMGLIKWFRRRMDSANDKKQHPEKSTDTEGYMLPGELRFPSSGVAGLRLPIRGTPAPKSKGKGKTSRREKAKSATEPTCFNISWQNADSSFDTNKENLYEEIVELSYECSSVSTPFTHMPHNSKRTYSISSTATEYDRIRNKVVRGSKLIATESKWRIPTRLDELFNESEASNIDSLDSLLQDPAGCDESDADTTIYNTDLGTSGTSNALVANGEQMTFPLVFMKTLRRLMPVFVHIVTLSLHENKDI